MRRLVGTEHSDNGDIALRLLDPEAAETHRDLDHIEKLEAEQRGRQEEIDRLRAYRAKQLIVKVRSLVDLLERTLGIAAGTDADVDGRAEE